MNKNTVDVNIQKKSYYLLEVLLYCISLWTYMFKLKLLTTVSHILQPFSVLNENQRDLSITVKHLYLREKSKTC